MTDEPDKPAGGSGAQRDPAARRPDGMPVGTPFPKGVSGNPSGMPKGHGEFRALIRKMTPAAVEQLTAKVEAGDLDAIRFVIEQGWGKAVTAPAEEGSGENVQRVVYELRVKDGA